MSARTVRLDVRPDIRAGAEPCSKILEQAGRLQEGDTLQLLVPFEPKPLYDLLARQGFTHEARALEGGAWEVRFTRTLAAESSAASVPSGTSSCGSSSGEPASSRVIDIDVRGLSPPQPLVRVLDALATLPEGVALRARTDRKPVLLFEQLEARGFRAEGSETSSDGYVTVIQRS
jgi:uncharacterized protein (DUF2249 family)